jgi:lipid A 3-O-deacylase
MLLKKLSLFFAIFFTATKLFAADIKGHQYNVFTGNFDFSDDKQSAILVGFQHQNENLERDTFLGNISPITGGFVTENSAAYIYTGFEWNVEMGSMTFTPSFAPGLYHKGDGKDLGHALEFKSEVQLSFDLSQSSKLGFSYNHISNASLGDKNPGANSYMFNFLKNF